MRKNVHILSTEKGRKTEVYDVRFKTEQTSDYALMLDTRNEFPSALHETNLFSR